MVFRENRGQAHCSRKSGPGTLFEKIVARHIVQRRKSWPGTLFETHRKRAAPAQLAHHSSTNLICTSTLRQAAPLSAPRPRNTRPHHAPNSNISPIENTREHKLRVLVNRFQMFHELRAATRCSRPAPFGVARVEVLHARRLLCSRSNSRVRHSACSTCIGQTESDRVAIRSRCASHSTNSQSIAPHV